MIDNYDSFTYNLVQYFQKLGEKVLVYRNDEISIKEIEDLNPDGIIISPGPCTPKEAGISVKVIKYFYAKKPIFGICLGHQSIAYAFGGKIIKAKKLMHGKGSYIFHNKKDIFKNVKNPFYAIRYHSLAVDINSLPKDLEITAISIENKNLEEELKSKDISLSGALKILNKNIENFEIMGIKHRKYPVFGVQFHPESILSEEGLKICKNFMDIVRNIKNYKLQGEVR